ncbi:MAG TPA: pitrilysin family protein [Candidatus Paceibacterota bacterium]
MIKKTTLKNGLRVVTIPQKGTKTVTVLVLVGTGSKYETKEISGISHFLEHMFFKGTTKRPKPLDVAEVLDQVGGAFNAFTGEEYTGYYAKVDSTHFDLALDWVADIFLHSALPPKEIRKEKGVVLEELHMYRDYPARHVDDLWTKLLYGDQPAGWNIVGTAESIQSFTRKDLQEYVQRQYVASNTVVCVAGNVQLGEAQKKVATYFSALSKGRAKQKQAVIERQTKPGLLVEYRKTNQTNIALGVRGYDMFHKDRYAQHVLAVILGGMMSSRLFEEIRERRGLAYDIGTSADSDTDTGCLVTTAGIKNGFVGKAIQVIAAEYKKLKTVQVSQTELKKAKENEKGKMALRLESSDAKANFYAMQELLRGEMLTPEQIYDKIQAVTAADIQRVAKDVFREQQLNLVVLGPHKNKQQFQQLLKI